MADPNPFDQFDKPATTAQAPAQSSTANPFDQFDKSATPKTTIAPSSTAPSVPWFSAGSGNDKIGEFFAKAGDTATFGLGAKLQDALGIGQKDGQTVAQQVESAGKDIGPIASAGADALGYIAGPGELRVGEGLGKLAASTLGGNTIARVGGRMLGSGVENAGATIVGNAGHDQNTTTGDLLMSLGLGAATGVLPGGSGERPMTPSTADLQNTASGLYKPLESKVYRSPDVAAAIDRAGSDVSQGLEAKMSSSLSDQIARINGIVSKGSQTTASDIADFRSSLMGAARNDVDKTIAGKYLASLDKGVGSQTAADIAAANRASNIAKTSSDIEDWAANPSGAPKAVKSALENNPNFYKTQPGLFDALDTIGQKANDPSLARQILNHAVSSAATGAIGAGTDYLVGGNPAQGGIEGALTGLILPHGIKLARAAPTRNALLAAQHLNATGMKVDPGVYTNRFLQGLGVMSRQAGYGAGSAGGL